MSLSKEQLKAIRAAMQAALDPITAKCGLAKINVGNCSFTPDGSFVFKVDGIVAGGLSREQSDYDGIRHMYDLPARGFSFQRNGKRYVFDEDAIRRAAGAAKPSPTVIESGDIQTLAAAPSPTVV